MSATSLLRAGAVGLVCVVAGCSPTSTAPPAAPAAHADHDHADHEHAHPSTLRAGVAAVAQAATAVKDHLAAGAGDAADEAVHELGHLLEDLQGLVRKGEIPADTKAAATKAIDELFECFDKLDTAIHAEPGSANSPQDVHASVAERIEAAIGALRQAASAPAAAHDEADAIIRGSQEAKEE